jgi:hypothetical protein
VEQLQEIVKQKDVRSADRAVMRNLLRKLRARQPLSYQERQNLIAYVQRYSRPDDRSDNRAR